MGILTGKGVVNTRAVHQAADLDRLLRERGAEPLAFPCVAIAPPLDDGPLRAALDKLGEGEFDWLVLTSVNTVASLAQRAGDGGLPLPSSTAVAAVGPATAESARRAGLAVTVVPEEHDGRALAAAIPLRPGERVLMPASAIARPELAEALAERGADVTTVAAYRTVVGEGGVDLPRLLADNRIDALTFASSSAVGGFVTRLRHQDGPLTRARRLPTVCIGRRTQETALERGFAGAAAARSTLDGLVEALEWLLGESGAQEDAWSRAS